MIIFSIIVLGLLCVNFDHALFSLTKFRLENRVVIIIYVFITFHIEVKLKSLYFNFNCSKPINSKLDMASGHDLKAFYQEDFENIVWLCHRILDFCFDIVSCSYVQKIPMSHWKHQRKARQRCMTYWKSHQTFMFYSLRYSN